jgi:hypothetical protein
MAMLAAAAMWCYADFVLIPHQKAQSEALGIPRGNLSDLYPRWYGSRELLLRHRDPYSDDVTREIQEGYYGRKLDSSRPHDPRDLQGFAYPVYVALLLAPTVNSPVEIVLPAFRWFLALLTVLSIPLWLHALHWRLSCLGVFTWTLFTLGSFAAVQGIKLEQLTLLVCGLLAGAVAAVVSGHLVLAGILLAVGTIKPQLTTILVAWLALWVSGDWKRRAIAYSFSATCLALILGGEVLLPGWISRFTVAASAYVRYTGGGKSVLDLAAGPLGRWLALIILALVAIFCWKNRRADTKNEAFAKCLALVLAATLAVIPTYAPYNQLLLVPALMLIVRDAPLLWRRGRLTRLFFLFVALSIVWPWVTAAILSALLLFIPPVHVQTAWALPLLSSLYIPLTVLGMTVLCVWTRKGQDVGRVVASGS